jgi:hypothetical protein
MEEDFYITADMEMAAYLMTTGRNVTSFRKGSRQFWQFEQTPELQNDVKNFLNNTPISFQVRTFCDNLRRLRMELAISRREA